MLDEDTYFMAYTIQIRTKPSGSTDQRATATLWVHRINMRVIYKDFGALDGTPTHVNSSKGYCPWH